jgi:DNA-binding MarR family transcriptional regulator
MEEHNWITRERSREDRRTYIIGLTELGRSEIDQLAPTLLRQLSELAGALTAEASDSLRQLCSCVGDGISSKLSNFSVSGP